MQTAREYLFGKGLAKAPTGRGRFSREAHAELEKARKAGIQFSDDAPKVEKPKTVKVAKAPKAVSVKPTERYDNAEVRKWARANGHTVGERGRIHVDVINAYLAGTETEERPEVTGELDVYRDARAHTYSMDTVFVDTDGKKRSAREACVNCRCSVVGCRCGRPTVVSTHGIGTVRLSVEGVM
jgi:hypothetical protein